MNLAIQHDMITDETSLDLFTPQTPADWVQFLIERHQLGRSQLPRFMGLSETAYFQLLACCGCQPVLMGLLQQQRQTLMTELLLPREEECQELINWLENYTVTSEFPLARIIAVASLGFNHLWQDLGLDSRQQLRELMTSCFPSLVAMNDKNMRWKKFFYKQLCALGGNYVCRSPSCDDCVERQACFAPEE